MKPAGRGGSSSHLFQLASSLKRGVTHSSRIRFLLLFENPENARYYGFWKWETLDLQYTLLLLLFWPFFRFSNPQKATVYVFAVSHVLSNYGLTYRQAQMRLFANFIIRNFELDLPWINMTLQAL